MIILASKEISKRNNLPVKLQYVTVGNELQSFYWFVEHSTSGGTYFEDFADVVEYIRERKLLTPKQLERINGTKESLLNEADCRFRVLQHIEDTRNTAEYRGAKAICEIRQQLRLDGVANSERDANKLIELHYLKEIGENLYQLLQDSQDK